MNRHFDVVHFAGHGDYTEPLVRWVVAQAEEKFGIPKSNLSPEAVRRAARAAKQQIVEAVGCTGTMEPELATQIPLTSLVASAVGTDGEPGCASASCSDGPSAADAAAERSIRLTSEQLSRVIGRCVALLRSQSCLERWPRGARG